MRRALDGNPPISTYFKEEGYGVFGYHAGYDYAVQRWAVRAPEAGTIIAVYPNRTTEDGGKIVELRSGKYDHRFLHLDRIDVVAGQTVSEGQQLGITGNTGKVDFHLHHDVRTKGTAWNASLNNYVDWEQIIKAAPAPTPVPTGGGNNVFNTDQEVIEAYMLLRGVRPSSAEVKSWLGQPKQRFFQVGKAEADSVRQQLADVRAALANEKAKPPKEVIKTVEKIVDRPIEVIKVVEEPVEVIKEVEKPLTWQRVVDFIKEQLAKLKKG